MEWSVGRRSGPITAASLALNPAIVMSIDNCVAAALAGLDLGEKVTMPSLEDKSLQATYDAARLALFDASQSGKPASRYLSANPPRAPR
ncbi:MAG: short chain dehydrogenase family protein [Gammaproteobacteria bacterium]|nr:short chain dehydrogenase family protein [Gammaproteobacteria bacterium]